MPLPPYNNAASLALRTTPPFFFSGVTERVFPLRADMYQLRSFCHELLNRLAPPEIARFEPFVPFVYLSVLHYGRMSVAASNEGWVSQHEIAFIIPLIWHRRRHGRWEFVDWVYLTPFIFVDDELSLTTGRQVYGWPKVLAHLDRGIDSWLEDPTVPQNLMSLSTGVVARSGGRLMPGTLLDIENLELRDRPLLPPSLRPLLRTATALPRAALGALNLESDLLQIWAAPPFLGYQPRERGLLVQGLLQGFRNGLPMQQVPGFDILTLKQFRDALESERACYQALVLSRMEVGRFNQGGVLGSVAYLQGDPSGGYRIRIYRYPSAPIVALLGLEVDQDAETSGQPFDLLRPVYPYWVSMDVTYGRGRKLCWRTERSAWHSQGTVFRASRPARAQGNLFNTVAGPLGADPPGPFRLDEGMVNLLPLQADLATLQEFVRQYLDVPEQVGRFEACEDRVYLAVGSFRLIASQTQPLGSVAARLAGFFVPVDWHRPHQPTERVFVPPFVFTGSQSISITAFEESGLPILFAEIHSPPDSWLEDPGRPRLLLEIGAQLLPVQGLGAEAEERLLVGIGVDPNLRPEREGRSDREGWKGLERQPEHRVKVVTLKQIRDSWNPQRACFQEYLLLENAVRTSGEIRGLPEGLWVCIYRYSSIPIVQRLGLRVAESRPGVPWGPSRGAAFDFLLPVGPVSFPASVGQVRRQSRSLCWRAGSRQWNTSPLDLPPYVGSHPEMGPGPAVPRPGTAGEGEG